jgi:hypothetical protein
MIARIYVFCLVRGRSLGARIALRRNDSFEDLKGNKNNGKHNE